MKLHKGLYLNCLLRSLSLESKFDVVSEVLLSNSRTYRSTLSEPQCYTRNLEVTVFGYPYIFLAYQ